MSLVIKKLTTKITKRKGWVCFGVGFHREREREREREIYEERKEKIVEKRSEVERKIIKSEEILEK